MKLRSLAIFTLFSGSLCAEMLAHSSFWQGGKNCPILRREKFTKAWNVSRMELLSGAPVIISGEASPSPSSDFIFDNPRLREFKKFEFMAPRDCFNETALAYEQPPPPENSAPATPHFEFEFQSVAHRDLFKHQPDASIAEVETQSLGAQVRRVHSIVFNHSTLEIGYGIGGAATTGQSDPSATYPVSFTSVSADASAIFRWTHTFGSHFKFGLSVPTEISMTFLPESSQGGLVQKYAFRASLLAHFGYKTDSDWTPYVAAGISEGPHLFDFRIGTEL